MDKLELAQRCAAKMYDNDEASRSLGMQMTISAAGHAQTRMQITDSMVNGFDICHGGLIFTLADSAFAFACNAYDELTVAAAANIEFLRPARLGDELTATAKEQQRGRSTGVYDVEVRDQEERLVALFRGRSAALGQSVL